MEEYNWFKKVDGETELEQGDIIVNCSIILPSSEHYKSIEANTENYLPLDIIEINGIVLSQSCDIVNDKVQSIIICPIISLKDLIDKEAYFKGKDARESLRQGREPAHHLLNKLLIEGVQDYYVVTFRHIHSIPKNFIKETMKNRDRIRLLPPYREHLSQSFARYFMRVGLPSDIDRNEIAAYGK